MVEALHLVFWFLAAGTMLYGFFKLRGTVQTFVIVIGLIIGLIVWFCNYIND